MAHQIGAFMTIREAASELGVSPTTAYRLAASRQIPVVILRGRVRVPRIALARSIEARSTQALESTGLSVATSGTAGRPRSSGGH